MFYCLLKGGFKAFEIIFGDERGWYLQSNFLVGGKVAWIILLVSVALPALAADLYLAVELRCRINLDCGHWLCSEGIYWHVHVSGWQVNFEFIVGMRLKEEWTWAKNNLGRLPSVYHCEARLNTWINDAANHYAPRRLTVYAAPFKNLFDLNATLVD